MDRVITIARCQWQVYWRRFRRGGHLHAGNQAILSIVAVLVLTRYLRALHAAALDLPQGRTRLFESLLFTIFMVWMFPLGNIAGNVLATRKLLHLPLTLKELFGIRLITLFIPPYTWIVMGGSLAICYPLVRAPRPLAGVVAALLFIAFAAFTGLTIAQLLRISFWRKLFLAALVTVGGAISYLAQHQGKNFWLAVSSLLPSALVTHAALGRQSWLAIGELALLAAITFLTAFWSFKKSLEITPKGRTQRLTIFNSLRIPGAVGGLAAKDFRYFRRLLDPYLGVLAAALGCFYLIGAPEISAGLFQILLLAVIFPSCPLAFNSFGLDNRAGMERLKLMPVTGQTILLGKNLAFLMIVSVQVVPLIVLAGWRSGLAISAVGMLEVAAVSAMYLAWGNWMSVNHPIKMQFFQFSSSSGLIVESIAGIMFGSAPGIIGIYLLHTEGIRAIWKIALVLLLSSFLYLLSVRRLGHRFVQKQDRILAALS